LSNKKNNTVYIYQWQIICYLTSPTYFGLFDHVHWYHSIPQEGHQDHYIFDYHKGNKCFSHSSVCWSFSSDVKTGLFYPPPQNKRSKSICDTRVYLLDCNVWCLAGLEYGAMTLASLWNVTSCVFVQNVLRNGSVFRPLNLILNARYHWGECFQSPCISVTKFWRNRYLYFQGKYSNL